jgi:hypothetical protein
MNKPSTAGGVERVLPAMEKRMSSLCTKSVLATSSTSKFMDVAGSCCSSQFLRFSTLALEKARSVTSSHGAPS